MSKNLPVLRLVGTTLRQFRSLSSPSSNASGSIPRSLVTVLLGVVFVCSFLVVVIFDLSYFASRQALYAQIHPNRLTGKKITGAPPSVLPVISEEGRQNIYEDDALVMLVPLNGTPTYSDHLSVVNARAGLDVLKEVPVKERYLVLSEGRIRSTCLSGAMKTAQYLDLEPGYNPRLGITILLEEQATTTVENIWFTDPILREEVLGGDQDKKVSIVVVGVSDVNPEFRIGLFNVQIPGVDVGHGARAYLNAVRQWPLEGRQISTIGYIPTGFITDEAIPYPTRYSLATWVLTVTGALYLPIFDRPEAPPANCTDQTYR